MTRFTSFLVALFATTALWAYDFKSGDLYYNITGDSTIEVTFQYASGIDYNNYNGITSIIVPSSITYNAKEYMVTRIGDYAFAGCQTLHKISFPETLTSIGSYAFRDCNGLHHSSITIPQNVTYLGTQAFMSGDCGLSFDTITIKSSRAPIYYDSFGYSTKPEFCDNVKVIYIPCGTKETYRLAGWGGFPLQETMSYNISVFSADETKGHAEVFSDQFATCTTNYIVGIPNDGYTFLRWNDGSTENPRFVQLTSDTAFTAEFIEKQYRIEVGADANQGYTIGDTIVHWGDSATIIAIPHYGYHFVRWEGWMIWEYWEGEASWFGTANLPDTSLLNPRTFRGIDSNIATTAIFAKNIYSITVQSADNNHGSAHASSTQAEYLDEVTLDAYPEYGYHFAQWSDGNTDNPRTLVLTQDTLLTAQFAPNQYTVSTASSDTERGSADGDTIANYGDYVTLTATANYGYRFDHWTRDWVYSTDNPLMVQVRGNATYTAVFEKNTFSITALSANDIMGSVDAPYSAEYLDTVILQAQPNFGYLFTQWSDGNTDNPRTFVLTQDTIFTAEFAQIYSGQCGDNLYWSYAGHTLSITGTGDMYDYGSWGNWAPWALFRDTIETITLEQGITHIGNTAFNGVSQLTDIELPNSLTSIGFGAFANCSKLTKIEIPNGVTSVGAQAFANCSKLGSVSLPSTLTTIEERAFAECRKLFNIYSYATEPPMAENNSFANYNVYLHVPCDNLEAYQTDMVFGSFKYIQCIGAENTDAGDDVTVTPADNNAVFVWPADGSAASYTLEIRKDSAVFCRLVFNANGQLSSIAFAPSRNRQQPPRAAEQTAEGFRFTVTGLTQATHYKFDMVVKDENDQTLHNYTGEFTTDVTTAVSQTAAGEDTTPRKVFRNGLVLIQRGTKTYTLTGEEVK